MSARALVTGGAGFIGSHLADRLLARGWEVVAFDNLAVGRLTNVAHLRGHPRFTLALGDIADVPALTSLAQDHRVKVIFHLAAIHYIPYCNDHPFDAMRINVLGTQAVIDVALATGVRKVVFTSTSDVYAVKDTPHLEDDAVGPFTVYGTSKLFAEQLFALAVSRHPEFSVTVARLFNAYGPRETNPHVLPEILAQLRNGGPGVLRLGNTWPRRDFIYVEDVAEALVALVDIPDRYEVVNVGSSCAYSVDEVVAVLSRLLDRPLRIETDPARVRRVERGCLATAVDKVARVAGWKPAWRLEDGLRQWLSAEPLA